MFVREKAQYLRITTMFFRECLVIVFHFFLSIILLGMAFYINDAFICIKRIYRSSFEKTGESQMKDVFMLESLFLVKEQMIGKRN